MSNEGNLAC